jgi:diaminopimelate epimerase
MQIFFKKYHGSGNDFIMIDNRERIFKPDKNLIEAMCHRNFGVGADGLILLCESESHDFSMRYYNSDGNEGSMCGNGGRCITAFAEELGIVSHYAVFSAIDGVHHCKISDKLYSLQMGDIDAITLKGKDFFLDTGSPHHIIFHDDIDNLDISKPAREIRYSRMYEPHGCNINFVEVHENYIKVRTYERGVEDETLSCGTGVTAAALSAHNRFAISSPVRIVTRGGNLEVSFSVSNGKYSQIYLSGPAIKVFEGSINI